MARVRRILLACRIWFTRLTGWPRVTHAERWKTFHGRCVHCRAEARLVVPWGGPVFRTHWECAQCGRMGVVEVRAEVNRG